MQHLAARLPHRARDQARAELPLARHTSSTPPTRSSATTASASARTCGPPKAKASRCASTRPRPISRRRAYIVDEVKALKADGVRLGRSRCSTARTRSRACSSTRCSMRRCRIASTAACASSSARRSSTRSRTCGSSRARTTTALSCASSTSRRAASARAARADPGGRRASAASRCGQAACANTLSGKSPRRASRASSR